MKTTMMIALGVLMSVGLMGTALGSTALLADQNAGDPSAFGVRWCRSWRVRQAELTATAFAKATAVRRSFMRRRKPERGRSDSAR